MIAEPVLLAEQLVEHLAEPEQLAEVDADREHAARLEHRLHHLQARPHEAHPLRVARAVVRADPLAQTGVVRVLLPAVVVAPVVAGVVRRIGEDQVDLATLAKQRGHRLEVVALDDQVAGLVLGAPTEYFLIGPQDARPYAASELAGVGLAGEVDADAALVRWLRAAR